METKDVQVQISEKLTSDEEPLVSPRKSKYFLAENIFYTILASFLILGSTIRIGYLSYTIAKSYDFNLNGLVDSYSFLGGHRDYSDYQWKNFRPNLWIICIFATIFCSISGLIKRYTNNILILKIYYLIMGLFYTISLHRLRFIYLFAVFGFSYSLCKFYSIFGKNVYIALTWIFCILIKVTSEIYSGYSIDYVDLPLYITNALLSWNLTFGMTMLKMISFNYEFSHIYEKDKSTNYIENVEAIKEHCESCKKGRFCVKALKFVNVDISDFSFLNYLIYVTYPPFYFAGPTILYNSFIFQVKNMKENKNNDFCFKEKLIYILKVLFCFVILEIFNHFVYVDVFLTNGANKHVLEEHPLNYFDFFILCLNVLVFVWLKFCLIWKFERLWGWFDGILAEENMNRCMYNNYCFEGFWRAWHRSYNIWNIRYIYVPLGGKKKKLLNTFVVFTFVALWHDLRWNLLIWGWFIYAFIVPEIIVKNYFAKDKFKHLNYCIWFRYLRAFGCALYILLMILANLIGYGIGGDDSKDQLFKLLKDCNVLYFILLILFFIPLVITQFFIRFLEKEHGIVKNY